MKDIKILVTRKWPESVEKKLSDTFDTSLNISDKCSIFFNLKLSRIQTYRKLHKI